MKITFEELEELFHASSVPAFKDALAAAPDGVRDWWMRELPEDARGSIRIMARELRKENPNALGMYAVMVSAKLAS